MWLWLGFSGAGGLGCGWGVLVRVRCPWLGLDRAVAFSGLSCAGAVRMAFSGLSRAGVGVCMKLCMAACVCAHAPNDEAL